MYVWMCGCVSNVTNVLKLNTIYFQINLSESSAASMFLPLVVGHWSRRHATRWLWPWPRHPKQDSSSLELLSSNAIIYVLVFMANVVTAGVFLVQQDKWQSTTVTTQCCMSGVQTQRNAKMGWLTLAQRSSRIPGWVAITEDNGRYNHNYDGNNNDVRKVAQLN